MEFHPIADEWPLMEGAEFDALVKSIGRHGVRVPCWKYEGKILDGRNRHRAAEVAGVPVMNWHEFKGSEEEARDLARLLNDDRRHLSREGRAEWVRKLHKGGAGLSTRAIADAVGTSPATVRNDLKSGGQHCPPQPAGIFDEGSRLAKVQELKALDKTDAEAAESLGVSTKTIQRAKVDIAKKQREAAPKVTGKDDKQYPAKRPEVKPASKPGPAVPTRAISLMQAAINSLRQIRPTDPRRDEAYQGVVKWIRNQQLGD